MIDPLRDILRMTVWAGPAMSDNVCLCCEVQNCRIVIVSGFWQCELFKWLQKPTVCITKKASLGCLKFKVPYCSNTNDRP